MPCISKQNCSNRGLGNPTFVPIKRHSATYGVAMPNPTIEAPIEEAAERRGDEFEPYDSGSTDDESVEGFPKKLIATAFAAAVFAALLVYALAGGFKGGPTVVALEPLPTISVEAKPPPEDSLGARFDEVRGLWNSLDRPPAINRPLRRFRENGPFDSFLYRFDNSAELVGAYDPDGDYLVALMIRSTVDHSAVDNMYLHLCQVINPFSPDCIDNYFEIGLDGQDLGDLPDDGYETTWDYEGNEWRVSIADELLTIRVLAPAAK